MGPIEVWLTQKNLTIRCMVIREDETGYFPPIRSLNMRGAQREATRCLTDKFEPVGRWLKEHPQETRRTFRPKVAS